MKEKLKVFATALALTGSIVLLPGCSSTNNKNNSNTEEVSQTEQEFILEPGQHILRIEERELFAENNQPANGYKTYVICPDGYELVTIYSPGYSRNYYVFTNTVPVIVTADETGAYTDFGTPVEEENTNDIAKTLVLRQ